MRLSKVCLTSNELGLPVGCQSGPVVSSQQRLLTMSPAWFLKSLISWMVTRKLGWGISTALRTLGRQKNETGERKTGQRRKASYHHITSQACPHSEVTERVLLAHAGFPRPSVRSSHHPVLSGFRQSQPAVLRWAPFFAQTHISSKACAAHLFPTSTSQ